MTIRAKPKQPKTTGKPAMKIRSSAYWRRSSIDELNRSEEVEKPSNERKVKYVERELTTVVEPGIKQWVQGQATGLNISACEWLQRLIEREYMRQSK